MSVVKQHPALLKVRDQIAEQLYSFWLLGELVQAPPYEMLNDQQRRGYETRAERIIDLVLNALRQTGHDSSGAPPV